MGVLNYYTISTVKSSKTAENHSTENKLETTANVLQLQYWVMGFYSVPCGAQGFFYFMT